MAEARVVFFRYNSICEPLYINALEQVGIRVVEENVTSGNRKSIEEQIGNIQKLLDENRPVFVMSINYFPVLSAVCNIYRIPYVSIIVDSPVLELYSETIRNPYNRIFIFDYALYQRHVNENPDCIFHMPLMADNAHMQKVIADNAALNGKYACDISFIGSLYTEKCPYNKLQGLSDYTRGFCDGLIECQRNIYGYNMLYETLPQSMVDEFTNCEGIYRFPENAKADYRALFAYEYLGVKVSEQDRIRLLDAISRRYSVDLYTMSDTSGLPGVRNRGAASSLFDMPLIFHNSKINLQITARTIETGLSQRVWDVLASGGFLLINYQQELFDYFEPGKDLDYFESEADLLEKIEFYLTHDDIRMEITRNGMEKVLNYHTPAHRMNEILQRVL